MMPQRLPPGVTQKQMAAAGQCPSNFCSTDSTLKFIQTIAHQDRTGVVRRLCSRCNVCLTYWETDTSGAVVKLKVVAQIEICPDCRNPLDEKITRAAGMGQTLCKNPNHVASKLVG
jgi:hypothetical protein